MIDTELQNALNQMTGETKALFTTLQEKYNTLDAAHKALQVQTDAIDRAGQRIVAGGGDSSPASEIVKTLMEQKGDFDRFKRIAFEVKSTLLSTGLTVPQPSAAIGTYGQAPYGQVRALFQTVPIDVGGGVFALEEQSNSGWTGASPQTEGQTKSEVSADLQGRTLDVRTIPAWIRLSKQALDDVSGLDAYINSRLLWALAKVVDDQIVAGDGLGQNLRGIVPFAVSFNTSLLTPQDGYDRATVLGAAVAQVRTAGFDPTFILLHPADAFRMRFTRDSLGQYVNIPRLPQIVETVSIAEGTFLAGDSSRALIRVRMAAVVEMSESDADNWTRNLITLRAEERMLLQVLSIRAFVSGSLSTSPA